MKFILLALLTCFALVSCKDKQQQMYPSGTWLLNQPLGVQVEATLLPGYPIKMPMEWCVKNALRTAAKERGIPLTILRLTRVELNDHSDLWNVTTFVQGVNDIDTIECIANTLEEIPFVVKVVRPNIYSIDARN